MSYMAQKKDAMAAMPSGTLRPPGTPAATAATAHGKTRASLAAVSPHFRAERRGLRWLMTYMLAAVECIQVRYECSIRGCPKASLKMGTWPMRTAASVRALTAWTDSMDQARVLRKGDRS